MQRPIGAFAALLLVATSALADVGFGQRIAMAAAEQVGLTLHYDPAYTQLAYPGGDVPLTRGVCSDVVIRAFRREGIDLQQLVHEDMRANFAAYPKNWGLHRPDRSIDHRRVLNLQKFLARRGFARPITQNASDYQAGDVVAYTLPGNLPHIGIVAARRGEDRARPFLIHNIGLGAQLEDVLFAWEIVGHYRWQ